jgi:hypothetical protein
MSKSLDDLPIAKAIGPNPDLPTGRLPTLQERHNSEGHKRPEKPKGQTQKAAPAAGSGFRQLRLIAGHPDTERLSDNYGKPSPIFRAKRKKVERVGDAMDPAAIRSMLVGARGQEPQRSRGMPTLAERFQKEGVAAYGDKFADHAKQKTKPAKNT